MIRFPTRLVPLCLAACASAAHACGGRVHVEVDDAGVYALDYAAIVAAQPMLADCAAADLQLTSAGRPVPLRLVGGDGAFVPGARIEWFGAPLHGPQSWFDPYAMANVYELGVGAGAARTHAPPAAAAAAAHANLRRALHLEQENLLLRLDNHQMHPGDEPDVWQWAKLTPVDPAPFTTTFDAPDAAAQGEATITLALRGVSRVPENANEAKPADHALEATLNGKALGTLAWDGRDEWRKTFTLPAAALKAKDNTLVLRVPRRTPPAKPDDFIVDVVMFNWLEANYPIGGDLGAAPLPFTAAGDGTVLLAAAQAPELYGSDGSYQRAAAATAGHFRAELRDGVTYAPAAARRAAPLRAVATADLRADSAGHDYVIVTHPSLRAAIEPLAAYHRAHGLDVGVYDVDDLYDTFNAGIAHPRAIRDLMAWAEQHWRRKPRYLLLVGDASTAIHHDARNGALSGSSYQLSPSVQPSQVLAGAGFSEMVSYAYPDQRIAARNLIPTWQYPSSDGQSASDNDFVALTPGDFHPTLAVGRLPVVTPAEVKAIVDKTLDYLEHPRSGDWRRRVSLISTSEMASYKGASDALAASLDRAGYVTRSIYSDATNRDPARYAQTRATLRQDLDDGNLIVHFLGHGGSYIWRVGAMGDLFSLEDVSALKNTGRYPMVLAMTCFSAPFDNPSDDSIGERFLREADKGAVAVFAASWKNVPDPAYSRALIEHLLRPGARIGDAVVATKAKVADRDMVEIYNLLGDPALVLAQPDGRVAFARSTDRWDPRLTMRVAVGDFGGEVTIDWLDAAGATLSSTRYQSRDAQFALAPPPGASDVRVYAFDTRTGYSAFGATSVLPPKPVEAPRPAPVATAPEPVVPLATAAPARPIGPLPPPHRYDPADDIARHGFESGEAAPRLEARPAPKADAPARRAAASSVPHPAAAAQR